MSTPTGNFVLQPPCSRNCLCHSMYLWHNITLLSYNLLTSLVMQCITCVWQNILDLIWSLQGSTLMELSARDQDVGNPNALLLSISSGERKHNFNTCMWDNVETSMHETRQFIPNTITWNWTMLTIEYPQNMSSSFVLVPSVHRISQDRTHVPISWQCKI